MRDAPRGGIRFNHDHKYDLQLSKSLIHERRLAEIFGTAKIERVELKSESWLWERTGNICVEYRRDGKPSGIATTTADLWVHELLRDDASLGYFMFLLDRLKPLVREAIKAGAWRDHAGDGGRFTVALLRLSDLLK